MAAQYNPISGQPAQTDNETAQDINNPPSWHGGPPSSHYPAATQYINNIPISSDGVPQSVRCRRADGVTGYVIWHRVPEGTPYPPHVPYANGFVDTTASYQPALTMPFAPVEAPTPGPSLLPAQQSSDGLGPQSEPWFISPQPPIASDTLDGDSTPVGEGMPRVIPMPSGDAVRTLSSGQPQGHLTATPRTPERQTDLVKIVHSRPLSAHNGRAIDLLTRPFPSSYVLDGVEHRCNDVTAVRRRSKFKDVFGDIHTQSSASTERTIQLGSDPPVFAGSPQVIPRESAPKKRPVKRSIASNPNVFPNKRGRRDGAAARPAIPDRINLPTQSQSLPAPGNNVETEIVESPEELALCLMDPTWYVVGNGIVPLPPAVKYDGMEEFFDFDQASEGWQDERFWINEDPNRDLEDGPPLTWFRKAEDLSFSLDPWVEGELLMRFPAVL